MSKAHSHLTFLPPAPRGRTYVGSAVTLQRAARRRLANKKRLTSAQISRRILSSVSKNSKALRRLKKANAGGVFQINYQQARMVPDTVYNIQPKYPLAFALNDFTSSYPNDLAGGQLFSCAFITDPAVPPPNNEDTNAIIVGNWNTVNPAEQFDLKPKYQQWSDQNNSTVSPVQYMPLSANYSITFNRAMQSSSQGPLKVRVDVIETKRQYLPSQFHDYTMPECLGSFQHMAPSEQSGKRNSYNPDIWKVRTKYVTLPAIETGLNVVRLNQSKRVTLYEKFPKKNIKLHLDTVSATQKEPFHLAVPPNIIRWCVVSVSDLQTGGATSGLTMKLQRTIRYRDLDNKPL